MWRSSKDDARWILTITMPECNASPRRPSALQFVAPDFETRLRLQRHHAVPGRQVHHIIHDNWREFRPACDAGGSRIGRQMKRPSARELRYVPGVALLV